MNELDGITNAIAYYNTTGWLAKNTSFSVLPPNWRKK